MIIDYCPECGGSGRLLDENYDLVECEYCKGSGEDTKKQIAEEDAWEERRLEEKLN